MLVHYESSWRYLWNWSFKILRKRKTRHWWGFGKKCCEGVGGVRSFEIAAVVHVLIETDHKHIRILFYDRFCGTRMHVDFSSRRSTIGWWASRKLEMWSFRRVTKKKWRGRSRFRSGTVCFTGRVPWWEKWLKLIQNHRSRSSMDLRLLRLLMDVSSDWITSSGDTRSSHWSPRRRHGGHEGVCHRMGQKLDELAAKELREIEEKRKKYVAKKIKAGAFFSFCFVCDARRIFFLWNWIF